MAGKLLVTAREERPRQGSYQARQASSERAMNCRYNTVRTWIPWVQVDRYILGSWLIRQSVGLLGKKECLVRIHTREPTYTRKSMYHALELEPELELELGNGRPERWDGLIDDGTEQTGQTATARSNKI